MIMRIVVIDGQGGGIGRGLVERIKLLLPNEEIIAVGTNAVATSGMMKAGAAAGATGENAVLYNCREADIIAGPIGIVLANAMLGEITPRMAEAVSDSRALKVLIPVAKSSVRIAGLPEKNLSVYLDEAAAKIKEQSLTVL